MSADIAPEFRGCNLSNETDGANSPRGGILLRTGSASKANLMKQTIGHLIPGCQVAVIKAEKCPEQDHLTAYPGLVAIGKAIQLSADPEAMYFNIFGRRPLEGELLYSLANDVMFTHVLPCGTEHVYNKPPYTSKEGLFGFLDNLLAEGSVNNYGVNRFIARSGEAVCCLGPANNWAIRGMVGVVEIGFEARPLTRNELGLYVYGREEAIKRGYDANKILNDLADTPGISRDKMWSIVNGMTLEELQSTNAACRWGDHPIFFRAIQSIDGYDRNDHKGITHAYHRLKSILGGCPIERVQLLQEATAFYGKYSKGSQTPLVNQTFNDLREMGYKLPNDFGKWECWRPTQMVQ